MLAVDVVQQRVAIDTGEVTMEAAELLFGVVLLGVGHQIVLVHGRVVAIFALKLLTLVKFAHIGVALEMSLEVETMLGGVAAFGAVIELLFVWLGMQDLVNVKQIFLGSHKVTVTAGIRSMVFHCLVGVQLLGAPH